MRASRLLAHVLESNQAICLTTNGGFMSKWGTDNPAVNAAFELVRKHGFVEAQRLAAQWRDMSSEGTATFSMHNAVCKQIAEFATVGAMYRKV